MLLRLAPALFVFLWSSGYIAAKLGGPYAEPFTFLSLRFLLVLAVVLPFELMKSSTRLTWAQRGHAMVAGMLMHAAYLGGTFWAIRNGMPAGIAALLVCLQPVTTAFLAGAWLKEEITKWHWIGLVLGLVGAVLVLLPKLDVASQGITAATVGASMIALTGMTLGTLYQKRFATGIDVRAGAPWQYVGALLLVGVLSLLVERREVVWSGEFVVAMAWLVLALSLGAISLLMLLIRQNAVSRIAGVFYLVPAVTAVMAYAIFGETLTLVQIAGMGLVMVAVFLIKPA